MTLYAVQTGIVVHHIVWMEPDVREGAWEAAVLLVHGQRCQDFLVLFEQVQVCCFVHQIITSVNFDLLLRDPRVHFVCISCRQSACPNFSWRPVLFLVIAWNRLKLPPNWWQPNMAFIWCPFFKLPILSLTNQSKWWDCDWCPWLQVRLGHFNFSLSLFRLLFRLLTPLGVKCCIGLTGAGLGILLAELDVVCNLLDEHLSLTELMTDIQQLVGLDSILQEFFGVFRVLNFWDLAVLRQVNVFLVTNFEVKWSYCHF